MPSNLVIQLAVDFVKFSPFFLFKLLFCFFGYLDGWKYATWYEGIPRICLGIVMLRLVRCVSQCVYLPTDTWQSRVCRSVCTCLLTHGSPETRFDSPTDQTTWKNDDKLCGFKTSADPSVHWQASIHQPTWQRGMNKLWNCVNGAL